MTKNISNVAISVNHTDHLSKKCYTTSVFENSHNSTTTFSTTLNQHNLLDVENAPETINMMSIHSILTIFMETSIYRRL